MNESCRTYERKTLMNKTRRKLLTKTLMRRYKKYLSERENYTIDYLVNTEAFIV